MDPMPNTVQSCMQIIYRCYILSQLNYLFEHHTLTRFAFLIQFLLGNILEHADGTMRNTLFISELHRCFKYPVDFPIPRSDAVLAFPYRMFAGTYSVDCLIERIVCQFIQKSSFHDKRIPEGFVEFCGTITG